MHIHRWYWLIGGIVLIGVGIAIGQWSARQQTTQLESSASSGLTTTAVATNIPSPPVGNDSFLVKRVIDGDTIELENGEKVRYIGIDTPETLDPRKPVQCFGVESSKRNKELVEGKSVWLVKDVTDRDRYGRLLRYVYLGDPQNPDTIFVNLELVREGFAYSYSYPPDIAHQDEFVKAQSGAQEQGRSLWSSCPVNTPTDSSRSSSPSLQLSPSPSVFSSSTCFIKGNIGSTGEKIYHLPGCGSYEKTQIDEGRGERWFCSEDDAVAVGWRKAKNC